jgi:hypothetical protein
MCEEAERLLSSFMFDGIIDGTKPNAFPQSLLACHSTP